MGRIWRINEKEKKNVEKTPGLYQFLKKTSL